MDAALAQPPMYQSSFIPHEIYRPLLEIAQQGYHANDILHWYLAIKHRIDTTNIPAPYSLTPPFSVCSPVPHDNQGQLLNNDANSPSDVNPITQDVYNTTQQDVKPWPEPLSCPTPKRASLSVATMAPTPPQQTGYSSTDLQSNLLQMLSPWSPSTATAFSDTDLHNIPTSTRWFTPGTLDMFNGVSRKRSASQSSLYQGTMSNATMPLLLPSGHPSQQSGSSFMPMTNSADITYLAPISIIPSRKRRKTLRKGERKILQPMQLPRQQI